MQLKRLKIGTRSMRKLEIWLMKHLVRWEGKCSDPGLLSPYFVTNREEMFFFDNENCKLLLVDKITNAKDLASVLKDAIKGGYPILIITSAWDDQREALDAFVASRPLGAPKIAVLKSHGFGCREGNYLDDVAVLTGATVIREKVGLTLENVESEVLGFAAKVVVADGGTTIVGDGTTKESLNREAEKIRELVLAKETALKIPAQSIKEIFQEARLNHQIEWLDARLVRLSERVAVIEVGAETEKGVEEKKQRFDVAIDKIKMAFKKSIVAEGKFDGFSYDYKLATKIYEDLMHSGVVKPTKVWENPLTELRCVAKIVEYLKYFDDDDVIFERSFNSINYVDDLLFELDMFTSKLINSDDVTAERLLDSINDVDDLLVMIDA